MVVTPTAEQMRIARLRVECGMVIEPPGITPWPEMHGKHSSPEHRKHLGEMDIWKHLRWTEHVGWIEMNIDWNTRTYETTCTSTDQERVADLTALTEARKRREQANPQRHIRA